MSVGSGDGDGNESDDVKFLNSDEAISLSDEFEVSLDAAVANPASGTASAAPPTQIEANIDASNSAAAGPVPAYSSSASSWGAPPPSVPGFVQPADALVGQQYSRYRLVRALGAGGMAQIFEGVMSGLGGFSKRVVIKMILPEYAALGDFKDMFVNEARIAALLNHPNIVQTFDFGEANARLFISMEFVDGLSLQQLFRGASRVGVLLGPRVALAFGIAIGRALEYVSHLNDENGTPLDVVHRDITPGNILISRQGEIKLTDFGVVKSTLSAMGTVAGTIKGKYAYMSPEQVMGLQVDHRSDLYSLGIVLWETVTQRRLFKFSNVAETVTAVSKGMAPKVTTLTPSCPPELERIISKALSPDRKNRYQTATDLLHDLEAFRDSCSWTVSGREIAGVLEAVQPAATQVRSTGSQATLKDKDTALDNSVPGQEASPLTKMSWPIVAGAAGGGILLLTILWLIATG